MEKKYNLKSPAVKRLMREAMELKDPTHQYYAQPLEQDLFEWHFTVRGPPDTEFAGGQYHGRITFPAEYPMKPPNIILLTPNGRFEVGKKICLSMSAHHPETWQPSWSLRTVLLALIGFMPTKGAGAIGALDYTPEERKKLAARSIDWQCETCGFDHHSCLLDVDPDQEKKEDEEAREIASHFVFKGEGDKEKSPQSSLVTETPPQDGIGNLHESETSLRQRTTTTAPQSPSTPPLTPSTPQISTSETSTNVSAQNNRTSTADFVSLIMLWVVALLLIFVILRRLSTESSNIPKSSY